ncbi:MAG: DUF3775 domain-containing protein [Rhodospirillales bacterium]|jgi:hypothetical protein|nr:DUF3775 domain-containing protein [Rhodospirillales bacterium]
MLTIPLEKVCFLVIKAREFDAKMDPEVSDPGDNPIDDEDREILFDYPDDPTVEEIRGFLESLNEDEAVDILALVWIGSGDYDAEDWEEAVAAARDAPEERRVDALLAIPLLGDYLECGLDELGFSCLDFEINRL